MNFWLENSNEVTLLIINEYDKILYRIEIYVRESFLTWWENHRARHRNFLCVSVHLGLAAASTSLLKYPLYAFPQLRISLLCCQWNSSLLVFAQVKSWKEELLFYWSCQKARRAWGRRKNDDVDHNFELSVMVPVFFHAVDVGECTHRGSSGALDETSMKEL